MYTISYPGLSAELVINKKYECKQFFELVASCGIFCRLPDALQKRFLVSINQNQNIEGIIFVTDETNQKKLQLAFSQLNKRVVFASFKTVVEYNSYGLRINKTIFTDEQIFKKFIKQYPNYLVLVSTPYSCPNLASYVSNEDTLANRSSLFFFENKKIYSKKFKEQINFIDEFREKDFTRLAELMADVENNSVYFLKPLGDFVGGTSVLPLTKEALVANEKVVKKLLRSGPCYLYRQLEALNIISDKGEHHGTQFRPFISNNGVLLGFAVKFSSQTSGRNITKTSPKRLSAVYNSSSGTSTSVIFECGDKIRPIRLALSKNEATDNLSDIEIFLSRLKIGDLSLTNSNDLQKIATALKPTMLELVDYFNTFFFDQEWEGLYTKFVTEKTYFDKIRL